MRGVIVYSEESLKINDFFASKLKSELGNLGLCADIVSKVEGRPDFAVMRVYDEQINAYLDKLHVPTFNNSSVAAICNDKWKTYLYAKDSIEMAPTLKAEECDMPYPRIVKARHGHGGSEVFWAANEDDFAEIMRKMKDEAIVQPPVGKRGRDLRVYVIDNKPVVAMLRKSENDFRSNFSLGGKAERYYLSKGEEEQIRRVTNLFKFDFAGIDFLLKDDGLILNEIEDVVGCRMVYRYTDIDIIKKYAEHIVCSLNHIKNS